MANVGGSHRDGEDASSVDRDAATGSGALPPREELLAQRGPTHVRAKHAGRHRRRPATERDAQRELARRHPVHPETLPMTSTAEAAIVADRLLDEVDPGDTAAGDRTSSRAKGTLLGFLREVAIIAVIAVVVAVLVKTFLVRPYYIPSASMEETLMVNDRIIVSLLQPDLVDIGRGDVVVFTDPGGWLPPTAPTEKSPLQAIVDGALEAVGLKPSEEDNSLIKRVIGMPGDHVVCCNAYGQIVINDVAISEPYVVLGDNSAASGVTFDVTVPADHLWVMGDNRYNSEDSRYHQNDQTRGFVPMTNVVGRAVLLNWPFDRFGVLGNYAEVFEPVPAREPQPVG